MSISHHEHNAYQRQAFTDNLEIFCRPIDAEVEERTSFIVASAKLRTSDRVLDVGTGTGVLLPHILRFGVHEVVACDLCESMLAEAETRFPGVRFWCGDVMHLPAEFGTFDACFLNAMFGNLWNQRRALEFLATRLATGGRIVVSHPLGAAFVEGLHRSDPKMVPHTMPDRAQMVEMIKDTPLAVSRFVDSSELYLCVLTRGPRHRD